MVQEVTVFNVEVSSCCRHEIGSDNGAEGDDLPVHSDTDISALSQM